MVGMNSFRQRGGASPLDGATAWIRLAVSIVFGAVGAVGMWAVVVVLPGVQAEFVVDRSSASLPFTAAMVGFGVGNVAIGRAIDRWGFWRPALLASVAQGAGFLLAAQAGSITQFSLLHLVIGFGTAATFGPLIADVSHWFGRRRGLAVTAAASGSYAAGVLWPAVMPSMMEAGGWRFAYAAIGTICLAVLLPLTLLLRRPAPRAGAAGATRSVRPLPLSPGGLQALLVVAGLGCCVAMSMPQVHIVAYCMDLGYGVARGADMLALMLAGGIVSRLGSGLLADRIGAVATLLIGSALQGLSLLLYIPFDGLASLYVVSLLFGLSQGGIVPCYAIIVRDYMPAAEAGHRVGLVMMATIFGMALGGWMSGWIYDLTGSYAAAFLNGLGWNLVNLSAIGLLFWLSRRPTPALS